MTNEEIVPDTKGYVLRNFLQDIMNRKFHALAVKLRFSAPNAGIAEIEQSSLQPLGITLKWYSSAKN